MAQYFQIHPQNPQKRLIEQSVEVVRQGGVIAYPTDSSYALACQFENKSALERIRKIRQLDKKHHFTLLAKDVKQISQFVKIGNEQYRVIKSLTPGPYTFILEAKRTVPNRLIHAKKRSIGIRIPDHIVAQTLLTHLDEPLMTASLILPKHKHAIYDPELIRAELEHSIDLVIDAGVHTQKISTILDCRADAFVLVRQGDGEINFL